MNNLYSCKYPVHIGFDASGNPLFCETGTVFKVNGIWGNQVCIKPIGKYKNIAQLKQPTDVMVTPEILDFGFTENEIEES